MDLLARRVAELCCFGCNCLQCHPEVVLKKWLNISSTGSDFSADELDTTDTEFEHQDMCNWERELQDEERRMAGLDADIDASRMEIVPCISRRQKSETFHAQYNNIKELRICVGTWNVAGRLPPEDLDIKEWLDTEDPADIYVLGLQEIIPLNAVNIFCAEDGHPAKIWNSIIRATLNKIQPVKTKYECCIDPSSPSRGDALVIEDELLFDSGTDSDELHPLNDKYSHCNFSQDELSAIGNDATLRAYESKQQESGIHKKTSLKSVDNSSHLSFENVDVSSTALLEKKGKLTKTPSRTERLALIWHDQLSQSSESTKQSNPVKLFQTYSYFKSTQQEVPDSLGSSITKLDLGTRTKRKKRSYFVRIVSKQMVGIFLTIWVRRSLRKHIQNIKVSTVGVGILGYIGNKGSVSVSMSIYQTYFCFICSHLTSGEKDGDVLQRNSDVQEIHRRTIFSVDTSLGIPKTIYDHERIIWLGDLNYRINLPHERTNELISKKEWSTLFDNDQLALELKKGCTFDGWAEGVINFAPTYKYEFNSENYIRDESKAGRRTPAWCDRILSYGKGLRLLKYKSVQIKLSDHRPVTAIYMAEVEVFSGTELQRALTFTDAEIEEHSGSEAEDVGLIQERKSFR